MKNNLKYSTLTEAQIREYLEKIFYGDSEPARKLRGLQRSYELLSPAAQEEIQKHLREDAKINLQIISKD